MTVGNHTEEAIELATVEQMREYLEWTECAAFRFVVDGDEVRFQVAFSLDHLTAPEKPS